MVLLYNLPPAPAQWDRIGVFYISFCAVWTTLVFSGMAFCLYHRNSPILKIRGLPLSFSAITMLHMYWILAQITYPIGRTMNVILAYDIQYFFMGTWFPLGIALFHASNLRFLHIAKLQRQFTHPSLRVRDECNGAKTSWLCRLRNMDYSRRVLIFIFVGMIFQVALTLGMWFACLKYHPTFGISGTELKGDTLPEQLDNLGRGWEWWPSVVWQFIWTWMVAPYLLFRAWGIRDTFGWRTQTLGCCIFSLHATPMFLIASYSPAFEKVNPYFTPSQWIHFSTMMFEIFTIFVPMVQVIRLWVLNRKVEDTNARWETASQSSTLCSSRSFVEKGKALDYLDEELGDRLLTITALDHVLTENPGPLQEFSALNDFSGENIAFLTRTANWKTIYAEIQPGEKRVEAFNQALDLYIDFISTKDAEFPLNISSHDLKRLEGIFEKPARILRGDASSNPATPFDMESQVSDIRVHAQYHGTIPAEFNEKVFDLVQAHVKYLVLTNTWPKFVAEMQNRRRSVETSRSALTTDSDNTLASRISSLSSRLSSLLRSWRR